LRDKKSLRASNTSHPRNPVHLTFRDHFTTSVSSRGIFWYLKMENGFQA
jgi:hypothetical protein